MPRGRRLLSPEKEEALYQEASLRDSLTDKALGIRYKITTAAVKKILARLRAAKRGEGLKDRNGLSS